MTAPLAPLAELPRIDEHALVIDAPPEVVWAAALEVFGGVLSGPVAAAFARLLGCEPARRSGWETASVGAAVPGFRIVTAEPPVLLTIAGRHRFSTYGIVLHVDPSGTRSRCAAESRAEFPGVAGALYRAAVIGTHGHVLAVRRLLGSIKRTAERTGVAA
jgi:hypothetical protein